MFEPRKVVYQHSLTGEDYDGLEYPACHVCGRVITEEDHSDEAGTDGSIFWDQYLHSPDGLEEIVGVLAWLEFEEERVRKASEERLHVLIADAVRDALESRGL